MRQYCDSGDGAGVITMNQRDKLQQKIIEFCNVNGTRTFKLSAFEEYCNYQEMGIGGNTPARTVSRLLQELRDTNKILFREQRGFYTLLDYPILAGELTETQRVSVNAETPEKKEYLIETYARNRGWVLAAKEQFGEYCLFPECKNTFKDNKDSPYIEVHHIIPLFEGGEDGLWNLSVVCAHHHRMAHFADDQTKTKVANYLLTETEKRL